MLFISVIYNMKTSLLQFYKKILSKYLIFHTFGIKIPIKTNNYENQNNSQRAF